MNRKLIGIPWNILMARLSRWLQERKTEENENEDVIHRYITENETKLIGMPLKW